MSTLDLAEFNRLLKNPNYHPLYSALEAMSVDELIDFLHKAGFKCGTAQDFKRVILWAVGDELIEKKNAALNLKPNRTITPSNFAEYLKRIHGHFIRIEPSEKLDTRSADKVEYLIAKLEELRSLDRLPDHNYVPDQIVSAIELRMYRWLWRYQAIAKVGQTSRRDAKSASDSVRIHVGKPTHIHTAKAEPLIPILNSIIRESRHTNAD